LSSTTAPTLPFEGLETLWFQVAGTLCNIQCTHCFISCGPANDALKMMPPEQVEAGLREARELGVREIYFTGGEPFLHPRMLDLLELSLRDFPTTVLTNGMLILERTADRLAELSRASAYSLEVRVSLEDTDPARNDRVRGAGSFDKALRGLLRLEQRGLLPIVTVSEIFIQPVPSREAAPGSAEDASRSAGRLRAFERFAEFLRSRGVRRPRIKFIPVFAMGALTLADAPPRLTAATLEGADPRLLQCSTSRMVAADGVYACPILVGQPEARMSDGAVAEALGPTRLYHSACTTCHITGMTCRNY
jgi:uncharacterized Fe-S cluster-containing radical SAM superfamily protein